VIEINVKCVFKILHKIFNPNFSLQFFSSYKRFYQSTKFPLYIFFLHGSIHCTEYASALITDFSNKRNYVDARIFTFVTYGASAKIYNICVPLFFHTYWFSASSVLNLSRTQRYCQFFRTNQTVNTLIIFALTLHTLK
jgi:hypothetical protein